MGQASTSPLVDSPRIREAYILILITQRAASTRERQKDTSSCAIRESREARVGASRNMIRLKDDALYTAGGR